jgi:hypothetical protein
MSDTEQELPAAPKVDLLPRDDGTTLGVMHLGDTIRTFIADGEARIRKLLVSMGISEFGMQQPDAEVAADAAISNMPPPAPPPPAEPETADVMPSDATMGLPAVSDDDGTTPAADPDAVPPPAPASPDA